MNARIAILCLIIPAAPSLAWAAEPHSVPWFVQHTDARREALRLCRDDHRLITAKDTGPICANAETAETRVYASQQKLALRDLDTPQWWTSNPALRSAALAACNRRADYDRPMLRYCKPARQSADGEG